MADLVGIVHIVSDLSLLDPGQLGVTVDIDPDLGYRIWGGKDAAGNLTKWLAKDKPAQISTLTTTGNRIMNSASIPADVEPTRQTEWQDDTNNTVVINGTKYQCNGVYFANTVFQFKLLVASWSIIATTPSGDIIEYTGAGTPGDLIDEADYERKRTDKYGRIAYGGATIPAGATTDPDIHQEYWPHGKGLFTEASASAGDTTYECINVYPSAVVGGGVSVWKSTIGAKSEMTISYISTTKSTQKYSTNATGINPHDDLVIGVELKLIYTRNMFGHTSLNGALEPWGDAYLVTTTGNSETEYQISSGHGKAKNLYNDGTVWRLANNGYGEYTIFDNNTGLFKRYKTSVSGSADDDVTSLLGLEYELNKLGDVAKYGNIPTDLLTGYSYLFTYDSTPSAAAVVEMATPTGSKLIGTNCYVETGGDFMSLVSGTLTILIQSSSGAYTYYDLAGTTAGVTYSLASFTPKPLAP